MICAAIDIGTNSVRLLVGSYAGGQFQPQFRELATTRLGSGLISTGFLSKTGRDATCDAVARFVRKALEAQAEEIIAFATSAMRDAADGREFAGLLEAETGQKILIISPETEAAWSFAGVEKSLPSSRGGLVFDLGGGSCELTWRFAGQLFSHSIRIGAVYLSDTFLHSDPPTPAEAERARRFVREQLSRIGIPLRPLIGVGGTVTSLAAMAQRLDIYDPERVHGYLLTQHTVQKLLADMMGRSLAQRLQLQGIQPERAAILPAGTLAVDTLLTFCGQNKLIVSEGDILLGSLYALADQH
jgi:exopolyphosphatase / guanosine-5'-triphosphate,3'-diphosphate pyrophosphatase